MVSSFVNLIILASTMKIGMQDKKIFYQCKIHHIQVHGNFAANKNEIQQDEEITRVD